MKHRIRCCSLNDNQWVITDQINSSLLHIDKHGKLIKQDKYNPPPRHIYQVDKNILVISTEICFNLYQLFSTLIFTFYHFSINKTRK